MNRKKSDKAMQFLTYILKEFGSDGLLCRGTSRVFPEYDDVNSSIYREYKEDFRKNLLPPPIEMEKTIVSNARKQKLFAADATNIEILTRIWHFDGKTALIDFSYNLMVAIFFACVDDPDKDGELIVCDEGKFNKLWEISYENERPYPCIIEPFKMDSTQAKIKAQSSVLVHVPEGYIDRELCKFFKIPAEIKEPLLEVLCDEHGITTEAIFSDLMGISPNVDNFETADLAFNSGLVKLHGEDFEGAIYDFSKAILLRDNYVDAFGNRGVAKSSNGDHAGAIEDFNRIIEIRPDDVNAYYNRGIAKGKNKDYAEAVEDFNKVIQILGDNAETYFNRGHAKSEGGDYVGAIEDYDRAVEINPNDAGTYLNRGIAKIRDGDHAGAVEDYNRAVEIDPGKAEIYYNRGVAKMRNEDYVEAVEDFSKAIHLGLDDSGVYLNRGLAKFGNEDYAGAIEDCSRAIQMSSDYANAYDVRGNARKALDQDEAAEKDLRKAEELRKQQADRP